MEGDGIKRIEWVGSSYRDLLAFPGEAMHEAGYALYLAQLGERYRSAKPLKGFGGMSVLEVVIDDEAGTFRVVYTVQFPKAVYVLHAFQKKSKRGIATPRVDIDRIERRIKEARRHYAGHYAEGDDR